MPEQDPARRAVRAAGGLLPVGYGTEAYWAGYAAGSDMQRLWMIININRRTHERR